MVLAAIFCFAYLKVKDTKYIILYHRLEFSTRELCKSKREKKYRLKCRAKFNVSYFNPGQTHTFSKKSAIFFHLKIYMQSTNLSILSGFRKHRSYIYIYGQRCGQIRIRICVFEFSVFVFDFLKRPVFVFDPCI